MSLSKRLRFEVFKRDSFTCQYCGRTPPEVVLHADHVVPVCEGGGDEEENIITSCMDCNLGKGPIPMERVSAPVNLDVELRQEKLEQLKAFSELKMQEIEFEKEQTMLILEHWATLEGQDMSDGCFRYSDDQEGSVKMFLKRLPSHEILDAMNVTFHQCRKSGYQKWKYFCGVCWRKIKNDLHPPPVETTSDL